MQLWADMGNQMMFNPHSMVLCLWYTGQVSSTYAGSDESWDSFDQASASLFTNATRVISNSHDLHKWEVQHLSTLLGAYAKSGVSDPGVVANATYAFTGKLQIAPWRSVVTVLLAHAELRYHDTEFIRALD